ncbi:hypothetical protein RclHR1_03000004 [Rhizophagus clarus]|uniref:Uncharacterized protein n=1 Tax=Rhizophagus clarus TaxID=94130 RepID=A0A2Z6RLI2_9GLOM|nr:hypothetical protein RclHR1_03000004 [Rhizophagus clarus]
MLRNFREAQAGTQSRIEELEKSRMITDAENARRARIEELEQENTELEARLMKMGQINKNMNLKLKYLMLKRIRVINSRVQTRCIQIAKEIHNEEPMIKYRFPFLNGLLELNAPIKNIKFYQRCKGLSIGFIASAVKNLEISLIMIAFVRIMEFPS